MVEPISTLSAIAGLLKDLSKAPFAIVGFFGLGYVWTISRYNFDLSLAIQTISVEGIIINSIVVSSVLLIVLILALSVWDFFWAKGAGREINDAESIFMQAVVFGLGLILLGATQYNYWQGIGFILLLFAAMISPIKSIFSKDN